MRSCFLGMQLIGSCRLRLRSENGIHSYVPNKGSVTTTRGHEHGVVGPKFASGIFALKSFVQIHRILVVVWKVPTGLVSLADDVGASGPTNFHRVAGMHRTLVTSSTESIHPSRSTTTDEGPSAGATAPFGVARTRSFFVALAHGPGVGVPLVTAAPALKFMGTSGKRPLIASS